MSNTRNFSSIGGLEKHIKIVKEMVLFPLIYGEIYAKFNLRPPRGLLFYGPPGTGKTSVASALAVECSNAEKKVSFISRKGSDCLSKYFGESEKKLQKIFQTAQQSKPCIIFFDEVDGLAPIRTLRQDFVYASVVSTLLALMDGLDNNSEIIVIGATNRLDAIDPALRRPGRFDRELYFPLPCYTARRDILSVYVRSWKPKPPIKFLSYMASKTVGYCGSDLQALCAEAVMCCVRRQYPQIYMTRSKLSINEKQLKVEKRDFIEAQTNIFPANNRITTLPIKKLSTTIYPLHEHNMFSILNRLQSIGSEDMLPFEKKQNLATSKSKNCPRIMLYGRDDCHTRHLGPALLHTFEHLPCHVLDVTTLFEETGRSVEETIIQKVKSARHTLPSLLYIPSINAWWHLVDDTARIVFTSLMGGLNNSVHMLLLMTIHQDLSKIPKKILDLFDKNYGELYEVNSPGEPEKKAFFQELFLKHQSNSNTSSKKSDADLFEVKQKKLKMEEVFEQPLRIGGKRSHTNSNDDLISKRTRLQLSSSLNNQVTSPAKLTENEEKELLDRIIECTENWTSQEVESIYTVLDRILENTEDNAYTEMNKCIDNYFKINTEPVEIVI